MTARHDPFSLGSVRVSSPGIRAEPISKIQRCEMSWNQDYKPDPETGVAILIVALFLAIFLSGIGVGVWLS